MENIQCKKIAALLIVLSLIISMFAFPAEKSVYAATKKYVKAFSVGKNVVTIKKGAKTTVKYKISVTKGTSKKIGIKISNKSIASAKASGGKIIITAKKKGKTVITVTTKARNNKGKFLKKKITVKVTDKKTQNSNNGNKTTDTQNTPEEKADNYIPSISYQAHIQNNGWLSPVTNGGMAGRTGEKKRLEALKIVLKYKDGSNMIQYRAHVQDEGWQAWKTSGEIAGTEHKSLRMEAIQIKLTDKYSKLYDIYYSVHVSQFGWLGWAKNGEKAGSESLSLQMEAIKIKVVKKGQTFNVGGKAYIQKPSISYKAHVENKGWLNEVKEGGIAGTSGNSLRMEAFIINLLNEDKSSGVEYRAHCSEIGWQNWVSSGKTAGTTGKSRAVEALQIKLKGKLADYFDIYYRVHVSGIGWLGWASNGQSAGTTGGRRQAEAFQIQLVYKGATFDRGGDYYKDLSYQPARWFMDDLNITQLPGGSYSHAGTMNFDVVGVNNKNIKAPFDCEIVEILEGTNAGNTVIIQSTNKVLYANGTVDYMSMAVGHDNDISDCYIGKKINQGEVYCQNGNYGADAVHSHVTVLAGKYTDHPGWLQVSTGNWTFKNGINPVDALYISSSTNIVNTGGLSFKTY